MYVNRADKDQLIAWEAELSRQYDDYLAKNLNLDLTRGKPSADQLSLANAMDGILEGNYRAADGTDTRNYGGLDGLPEMKAFAAELLEVAPEEVLVGGNSSLNLMYWAVVFAWLFGPGKDSRAWKDEPRVKFICPSPGYDRHFAICEELGIEMVTVAINDNGPDMDAVEHMVANDKAIKGIWCVPRYSNPTGCVYSEETVKRLAKLGQNAAENFRVFYDNAYVVHHLTETPQPLAPIWEFCRQFGTQDCVLQFSSTSKITLAGAGVSFLAASQSNLATIKKHLGMATIGPDKVNQLRHITFIDSMAALNTHMQKHAELLKPRFNCVLSHLQQAFGDSDLGCWSKPQGGYFISFDALPGTASEIINLSGKLGVKLTPAGSTYPYGKDPTDSNIRLAPSFPSVVEIDQAMAVFVLCVKLASVRKKLATEEKKN